MTQQVFLTGDRTWSPVIAGQVAIEMLRIAGSDDVSIATGDNKGVEEFVRTLAREAGIEVNVIETPRDENGKPDFPHLHKALAASGTPIVVVHPDPQASHIVRSVVANVPEQDVRLVTLLDMIV